MRMRRCNGFGRQRGQASFVTAAAIAASGALCSSDAQGCSPKQTCKRLGHGCACKARARQGRGAPRAEQGKALRRGGGGSFREAASVLYCGVTLCAYGGMRQPAGCRRGRLPPIRFGSSPPLAEGAVAWQPRSVQCVHPRLMDATRFGWWARAPRRGREPWDKAPPGRTLQARAAAAGSRAARRSGLAARVL